MASAAFDPTLIKYVVRLGSVRHGLPRFGSVYLGSVRSTSVWFGFPRFGSVYFGSVRIGSVIIDFHFLLKNDLWDETLLKILYFKKFSSI